MVDSVNKLIANYQSKLTGAELEQFKSMPEDKQLAIAMVKTDKAAPTDLGALSNLDAKPGAKSSDGIFSKGQPPEENSTGLVLERKGAPFVDDKTGLPSTEIPKERSATPKTTQYAVQLGDSIEGVVKKSLKAQGIGTPDEKQLKEATEKFTKDNEGLVKTNKKGVKFLSAGSTIKLDGDVDVTHNKSAKHVSHEWAKKYGHVSGTTEHKDGTHVDKAPAKAETPAKHTDKTVKATTTEKPVDAKPVKGKNVTPTAEEIKGIKAEKGGYFIKNTKTGLISQIYNNGSTRILNTYDAKTKKLIQEDSYFSDKVSFTNHYDKNGETTTYKKRNADGSSETEYGTAKIFVGNSQTSNKFGRRIVTDIHGKETHYTAVRDESKPNQGETKWVLDNNPTKTKAEPAPKAAPTPAAKVAADAAAPVAPKLHVGATPAPSTKQNTPASKVSVPQNTPTPKTETVKAKPQTTESTTDDKSKIAKPQTGTDQLAEAKLYKPKNGFSLPNIEYGTKKAEVAKESGLVRDKTTGLFSRTFSEGGVSRTEKYDANKKLVFAESKYQSGDVTTKFYQNGKISKKVLKTDKGTTTFEGYVDDKTPTKCTQIINGKKEITKWDAQKEDWVKPEPPKAPIKETTTNMYRKGKLIRKEVKHKDGTVDLYDGYNPVPGGKSDFTLKVVTDDKGKKTYFQRDPEDGDYNKIR